MHLARRASTPRQSASVQRKRDGIDDLATGRAGPRAGSARRGRDRASRRRRAGSGSGCRRRRRGHEAGEVAVGFGGQGTSARSRRPRARPRRARRVGAQTRKCDAAVRDLGSDRIAPRLSLGCCRAAGTPSSSLARRSTLHGRVGFRTGAVRNLGTTDRPRIANYRLPSGVAGLHTSQRGAACRAKTWWQRGIVYQIYPRSFQDSNGDGVGDLPGHHRAARLPRVARRRRDLDLADLSLADGRLRLRRRRLHATSTRCSARSPTSTALVAEAHARGLKVILDFVPNHTSDQHPWFVESALVARQPEARLVHLARSRARTAGRRTTGSATSAAAPGSWDAATGQYYYHAFLQRAARPELAQPGGARRRCSTCCASGSTAASTASASTCIWHLIKDDAVPRQPAESRLSAPGSTPYQPLAAALHRRSARRCTTSSPRCARRSTSIDERVLIGEIYLPIERLVAYYGATARRRAPAVQLPADPAALARARDRRADRATTRRRCRPDGWPNWVLGNHDQPRIASRVGAAQARVAAMLLLTLRGTPTLYYGDELGMHDVTIPPERVQDPFEKNVPGLGLGRDPERTPMQWDGSPKRRLHHRRALAALRGRSRDQQRRDPARDPGSILTLYRR